MNSHLSPVSRHYDYDYKGGVQFRVFRALEEKPKKYFCHKMKMTSARSASRVRTKRKICLPGFVRLMYK